MFYANISSTGLQIVLIEPLLKWQKLAEMAKISCLYHFPFLFPILRWQWEGGSLQHVTHL